jgi:hypothetical protein
MEDRLKLWLRRWTLRTLRKLVDLADDRLHAAEVSLRKQISGKKSISAGEVRTVPRGQRTPMGNDEPAVGLSRLGNVVIPAARSQRKRRRRGVTASAFDLRFSSSKP